jgi:hypothetical protein
LADAIGWIAQNGREKQARKRRKKIRRRVKFKRIGEENAKE